MRGLNIAFEINDANIRITSTKGMYFRFIDGENSIEACFASFSGVEKIYLNENLISEAKGYGLSSSHEFASEQQSYKLELQSISLLKGEMRCSLHRDGELVNEFKVYRVKPPEWHNYAFGGVVGGVSVWLHKQLDISYWSLAWSVVPVLLIYLWINRGKWVHEIRD